MVRTINISCGESGRRADEAAGRFLRSWAAALILIRPLSGCVNDPGGGDFLILRASGDDDYNPYIKDLCHINSVATLLLPDRASAEDPFVAATIRKAEAVFIAGGDQANYINFWMGTPVQTALNEALKRNVPIGGTSAGLAVQSEFVFKVNSCTPRKAILRMVLISARRRC